MSQSGNPYAQHLARRLQLEHVLGSQQEAERRRREEGSVDEPPPDIELPGDEGPEGRAQAAAELEARRAEEAARKVDPLRTKVRDALASRLDQLVDLFLGRPELLAALLGVGPELAPAAAAIAAPQASRASVAPVAPVAPGAPGAPPAPVPAPSQVPAAPAPSAAEPGLTGSSVGAWAARARAAGASENAGASDGGPGPDQEGAKSQGGGGPPTPPRGGAGGPGDGGRRDKKPKVKAPTKGQRMVGLLEGRSFFRSLTGRLYLEHQGEAVACDSARYNELITGAYWQEHRDTVGKATLDEATRVLGAQTRDKRAVPIRVAGDARRLVLDLGDKDAPWEVTAQGIAALGEADAIPCFHRPAGSSPLPRPLVPSSDAEAGQAMAELRELLGIEDDIVWTSVVAWMVAALRPVGPYPVLLLRGEKGSGKSTLARALRRLVDPRQPDLKTLPKGREELRTLAISAEHAHILAYDNLSGLDGDLSDALCRLSTGDAFEARALYTGRDLDVFIASRPLVLTSITDVATRPDLLDRSLLVRLPPRAERNDDDLLMGQLDALAPRVLGALLWAIHRGMQRLAIAAGEDGAIEVPGAIRLRAPARWAAAAERALGLADGAVIDAYLASKEEAEDVDAEDPFAAALLAWIGPGCSWKGTAKDLLTALTEDTFEGKKPPGYWPETPRGMRGRIDRSMSTLRAHGLKVTFKVEGHLKTRTMRLERAEDPG